MVHKGILPSVSHQHGEACSCWKLCPLLRVVLQLALLPLRHWEEMTVATRRVRLGEGESSQS